jgi:hypothetical protein
LVCLIALGTLGVSLASPSTADDGAYFDGVPGDRGYDIREIRHGHEGKALTHRIDTWNPWDVETLQAITSEIVLEYNTDADRRLERVVVIDAKGAPGSGGWRAVMFNVSQKSVVGYPRLTRADDFSVIVTFPGRWLSRKPLPGYGWRVHTAYESDEPTCIVPPDDDPNGSFYTCHDYAPHVGMLRHQL